MMSYDKYKKGCQQCNGGQKRTSYILKAEFGN